MIQAKSLAGLTLLQALSAASAVLAAPALQTVYEQKASSYIVSLQIDPALKRYGATYVNLRNETLRGFNSFEREAISMRGLQGSSANAPWIDHVEYRLVAETPHLFAIVCRVYVDRRAARPDVSVQGLILDRASGHHLDASDLLKPATDPRPLDFALQQAVDAAKMRRLGPIPPTEHGAALPTWASNLMLVGSSNRRLTNATLAASDVVGKAAGLAFFYGPDDPLQHDDGYRVLLPAAVFASALQPRYREDFGGAPAPMSDDPAEGLVPNAPSD